MPRRALLEGDIARLREAEQWMDPRVKFILTFLLETGLRIGEFAAIRWDDITHQMVPKNILHLRPSTTKGKHPRDIPLTSRCQIAILNWQLHLTETRGAEHCAPGMAVIPGQWDNLTVRQLQREIRMITLKVLGHPYSAHTFRHTFATRLLAVSSTRAVQLALGHVNVKTTELYTHIEMEKLRGYMQAMG